MRVRFPPLLQTISLHSHPTRLERYSNLVGYTYIMNRKNVSIFIASVCIASIPLFLTFNRGINYFDEGYILEAARRIAAGELPYRDFHFVYTPAIVYFLSLFLRLGGQYLIIERLTAGAISIFGIVCLGLLARKLTKNTTLAFLCMFSYAVWGPAHLNFMWPVMNVLPLVFCYLYLFLGSRYFLSGVVMALILLTKQNFGAALIISFLSPLLWFRPSKQQILRVCLGFMSVLALFIIHLLVTSSFIPFISDINRYTIQEIVVRKSFSVPFPTDSLGKFILYLFPALVSLGVGVKLIGQKKKRKLIIIPLTILAIYLLGIFPTPDWPHLTPLLSMVGLLFIVIPQKRGEKTHVLSGILLVGMIITGICSLIFRNYYRWEAPVIQNTHCFSSGPLKYICADDKNYAVIMQTVPLIAKEAVKDTAIFAFYNNPIYFFLTQKNNPTSYIDFNVALSNKDQQTVISKLSHQGVRVIITRFPPRNNPSQLIAGYIEKNYKPIQTAYEFTVWKKKD